MFENNSEYLRESWIGGEGHQQSECFSHVGWS